MAKIAEYLLDEGTGTTAADSVASYDGTLDGTISWAASGVQGSAYAVSPAISGKVHIPDVLTVSIGINFGASAWVQRTAGSSSRQAIISPEFGYNSFEFCLCAANSTADKFSLDYGASWVAGYGLAAGSTYSLNTWYHLAGTARFTTVSVSNCDDNGSGAVRVTAIGHGFSTGRAVRVRNVAGTTEANGAWSITAIDADHFDLDGSTFTNAYASGGTACIGEVEFWVNAVSQGVANLDVTVMGTDDGGDDWNIGAQEDNYTPDAYAFQFIDGKIDKVAIYDSALDQIEVDALYGDGPVIGVSGSGNIAVGSIAVDSSGAVGVSGSSAVAIGSVTTSADGVVGVAGSSAVSMGPIVVDSSGVIGVSGSGDVSIGSVVCVASGETGVSGVASIEVASLGVNAEGDFLRPLTGSAVLTIEMFTLHSVGLVPVNQTKVTIDAASCDRVGADAVEAT